MSSWWGSGFITQIIYASFGEATGQDNTLITENNFDLLTEDGRELLVE